MSPATQPTARQGRLVPDESEEAFPPPSDAVIQASRPVEPIHPPAPEDPAGPAPAAGGSGWQGRAGVLAVALAVISGLLGGVVGARLAGAGRAAPAPVPARTATPAAQARPAAAQPTVPPVQPGAQPADAQVQAVASAVLPVVVQVEGREDGGNKATGAGVIIRADGYVVTNRHVVDSANSIQVTLPTAEPLAARLVGSDPNTDLAVVRVSRRDLPAASFGRSADLRVGDEAIAVGSPFGFRGTVTAGIISALHRVVSVSGDRELVDAIQTDAAINPGNSGGALANSAGQVVGINTAIATPDGGPEVSAGIGFAIPIDDALAVAKLLIARKKVRVPYLGVGTEVELSPEVARRYKLGSRTGALVTAVLRGSPAARSGLRRGDLVVRFGTTQVTGGDELKVAVRQAQVDQPVPIVVLRRGKELTLRVTPTDQPD